jgi:hypothetical protein
VLLTNRAGLRDAKLLDALDQHWIDSVERSNDSTCRPSGATGPPELR